MADDESLPTVSNGRLSKPYPLRTKGDVNRMRVLPPPAYSTERPAAKKAAPKPPAPAATDEQPKSGFDYVVKRNKMMRGVSNRGRRSGARTARA